MCPLYSWAAEAEGNEGASAPSLFFVGGYFYFEPPTFYFAPPPLSTVC